MTFGQRKAHKHIWLLLFIIVPAIMICAVKNLDIQSSNNDDLSNKFNLKAKLISVVDNDTLKVALYKDCIEVQLKKALKNPSAVVYGMDSKGNKTNAIGQLAGVGTYMLKTNNILSGIIVFDEIKEKDIFKILF